MQCDGYLRVSWSRKCELARILDSECPSVDFIVFSQYILGEAMEL
jgi:hypothetical protein